MNLFNFFKKNKNIIPKNIIPKTIAAKEDKAYSRELVVSVYREKVEWLVKRQQIVGEREKISAYVKSDRNDFKFADKLPNIGRESHTYIYHIIKNYNNLADFTTFVQGGPFFHFHGPDNPNLEFFNFVEQPVHDYNPLGDFAMTDCFGRPFSHWDVDLFPVWDRLFEGNMPHRFFANFGAQYKIGALNFGKNSTGCTMKLSTCLGLLKLCGIMFLTQDINQKFKFLLLNNS